MADDPIPPRRQAGFSNMAALALIFLLCAGGWNYYRSYRADVENYRSRPFGTFSTPDLISLQSAYGEEVERNRKAYAREQNAHRRQPRENPAPQRLSDRVKTLEKRQAAAGALRDIRADFAQSEARLGEVEAELQRRSEPFSPLRMHLERLFRRDASPRADS